MSESCTANIANNSGRPLDAVILWHTPGEPGPSDVAMGRQVLYAVNLANGKSASASVPLAWSATDYWVLLVRFKGDGQTYVMAGETADPYKEYEVSDGSSITFTINAYSSGTTNQNDIGIAYSGDDGGSARLLNPIVAMLAGAVFEAAVHTLGEMVAA